MSINSYSRFSQVPHADIQRSKFNRDHSFKFSANVGEIIPFMCDEILPGDTFQIRTNKIVRLQTLVAPIMDSIFLDTMFFFVPSRLCWEHWKQFNGENTESKWVPQTQYSIPQITSPAETGWDIGTIADYFGIPTGIPDLSVNALPFRAYALICNEWFRDENNLDYLDIPLGDATVQGVNTGVFVTDVAKGGKPYVAAKYHDYFTSALPAPLKSANPVEINVGSFGPTPVIPMDVRIDPELLTTPVTGYSINPSTSSGRVSMTFDAVDGSHLLTQSNPATAGSSPTGQPRFAFDNLYANSGDSVGAVSINALRLAFATQRMLERDARGGTRYIEMIKSHFGVSSPDGRLQRPEYLGGNRIPININQVVQTSGEIGNTPQGNVAGYSVTSDSHGDFIKSFTEHGYLIGLAVMRYDHTYQQGLDRMWSRLDRTDFYLPVFANLGEQPILNKEIYCQGTDEDNEVFGYQEAWAEYRYKPSRVVGEMRSTAPASLDVWHLGDEYTSLPVLQSAWIQEDKSNLDRVLQVTSDVSNQYWADFYIQCEATRPMPLYSVPGLLDHN